jgi:hypothetical protein
LEYSRVARSAGVSRYTSRYACLNGWTSWSRTRRSRQPCTSALREPEVRSSRPICRPATSNRPFTQFAVQRTPHSLSSGMPSTTNPCGSLSRAPACRDPILLPPCCHKDQDPTAVRSDRASDLHFLVAGARFEPATSGLRAARRKYPRCHFASLGWANQGKLSLTRIRCTRPSHSSRPIPPGLVHTAWVVDLSFTRSLHAAGSRAASAVVLAVGCTTDCTLKLQV